MQSLVRKKNPKACPNDGFMEHLLCLEDKIHGKRSMALKRKKPLAKHCPECGDAVGISDESLAVHLKMKHGDS